ncbi:unnamed protein product [Lactuca virosa]|uniref:Uncharacterized protein n=1 Tax=Lactuca virosa TaxID=75947 RepID=A0AAU9PS04_9ASTR|nr:unnamed protein product [Lactuca virosa]
MDPKDIPNYHEFRGLMAFCPNITTEYLSSLWNLAYQSRKQNQYSKPMPWIGMYIALASLLCVLAMVADLLHGLRNRKLWFPCKYFTLNAASLTVIAVAIKLPMDLTTLMPGYMDQVTKIGSMSFMCTMMANLLPSLATKDNEGLVSNIIALALLVISLVVNFCIQISTGILFFTPDDAFEQYNIGFLARFIYVVGWVVPILMLLIIYACSALAILKSKQILELNYQRANQTALKDQELKAGRLTVEKLKQHVRNYWIMAGTGSPQFMTACSATTSAAGAMFSTSRHTSGQQPKEQVGKDKDLTAGAEKQQPKNLMKLLSESRGFEGLAKFDSNHVPSLLSQENVNCWSLPLVTLTCIAMSLPDIQKNMIDCLLNGVSEGLLYVTLVEETLNATDHDHAGIQKAAETLWVEVEVYHKWLGTKLPNPTSKVNTPGDILQWLRDKAKNKVLNVENMDITDRNDNWKYKSICANSMYRITETILLSYHENIEEVSQEELFSHVSSMIADIIAACLTNLPQVIRMKCTDSAIEKREANVQAAAQLLGETTQIINSLQDRELPSLNPDELAFIDKWCAYLKNPFP